MFKDVIKGIIPTELLERVAPHLCSYSSYGPYSSYEDETLETTMTLLLYSRLKDFKIYSSVTQITNEDFKQLKIEKNKYSFICISDKTNPDELLSNKFGPEEIQKWPSHEKFFLAKTGSNVKIRTIQKHNIVCVFSSDFGIELCHLVQSLIPTYFPIFKDQPPTEDEMNLLRSLTLRTSTEYKKAASKIISTESFRKFSISFQIAGFQKQIYSKMIKSEEEKISRFEIYMQKALESYRDAYRSKSEANIRLAGLIATQEGSASDDELETYLIENKNITNLEIEGSNISFIVKTYLIPYLMDDWATISERGGVYNTNLCGHVDTAEKAKLLLDAIFSYDHCLKLKMCAKIVMNVSTGSFEAIKNFNYSKCSTELKDYVPNPHLDLFNCFGMNGTDILTNLDCGDLIGAVECAVNVVKRVNVSEYMVFNRFLSSLYRQDGKCLVTGDGRNLTIAEAIEYLSTGKENKDANS